VTLQVSLAPTDLPTARHVLPHQLRQWAAQVDEILFIVDLHRGRGRFAEGWSERLPGLRQLVADCCAAYSHARALDVDYSPDAVGAVEAMFFAGRQIPAKDHRGAPFYPYFFGLWAARHDAVLHTDSDMLYGGGSPTWVGEALTLLEENPRVLACCPLPGPPTADGGLRSQRLQPFPHSSPAFQAHHLSFRLFLLNRAHLRERVGALRVMRPERGDLARALVDGHPLVNSAETLISLSIARRGLLRVDFLGRPPGMWAVHPPYRSQLFYQRLPSLVHEIEAGEIAEEQRGCQDLNDSMVDWTGARKSWARRLGTHLQLAATRLWPERRLRPTPR
jgi:hypothetical protein